MQMMDTGKENPKRTAWTRALLPWILVGLVVGGIGGAADGHHTVNNNAKRLSQMIAVSEYQNLALLQYKYADAYHARQSMQDLLNFMNQVEKSGLVVDWKVLEFDRGLAYMRLAIVEEKSGDFESSKADLAAAAACSRRLGNTDTTEEQLRRTVTKLDSYLP